MIVDAHLHLWDPVRNRYAWLGPQHAPIDRVVTADEALGVLRAEGVTDFSPYLYTGTEEELALDLFL